jgi:excisionase family DNA binding protein
MDELVSVAAAAARLGGISKWTVYVWLSKGKLTRVKVGKRTMILVRDLDSIPKVGGKPLVLARSGEK